MAKSGSAPGNGVCSSVTLNAVKCDVFQAKQTYAVQNAMSALHPKADMCGAKGYVRFVPIADIHEITNRKAAWGRSLRNLIRWNSAGQTDKPVHAPRVKFAFS